MGSVLAALYELRPWGKNPHVDTHCDFSCSTDDASSSSSEPKVKEEKTVKKTWLEKHRPK
jgi:hypothetical protein